MDCSKYKQYISQYLDSQLSSAKVESMFAHLQQCESCQKLFDEFNSLETLVENNLERPDPPFYLEQKLFAQIARDKVKSKTRFFDLYGFFSRLFVMNRAKYAFAGITVLAFAFILNYFYFLDRQPTNVTVAKDQKGFRQQVQDYLENSEALLTDIKNTSGINPEPVRTVSMQNEMVKNLIVQSELISKNVHHNKDEKYLYDLVKELEPVFWDIHQTNQMHNEPSMDFLKKSIHNNQYLLKLNVAKAKNRTFINEVKF